MAGINEDAMIARLERRLATQYRHLPPDQVAGAIENARASLAHSRIRDFIPLLVERRVNAELAGAR